VTSSRGNSQSSPALYYARQLAEIAARWDAKAQQWDKDLEDPDCHLNEDQAYQRFLSQLARQIQQRADFCASHGVVDAGCATGLVLDSIIASFAWGIGVDISPRMIEVARAKHIQKAEFIVGDCFQLPALCPKAGAVFSRGVLLSHYGSENGLTLLQAAHGSLVARGFVCFDYLNQAGRRGAKHAPENKTYFTSESVGGLAQAAGFDKVEVVVEPSRRVGLLIAERA
jgi:predicted TPR repeat methyltransferase